MAPDTAPQGAVSSDVLDGLLALEHGWNGRGSLRPTDAAMNVLGHICVVPMSDGGVQIEWHANGWDVEMVVGPEGTPTGISMEVSK